MNILMGGSVCVHFEGLVVSATMVKFATHFSGEYLQISH